MRLNELKLIENDDTQSSQVATMLLNNASKAALGTVKRGQLLWRGTFSTVEGVELKQLQGSRSPKDMPEDVHHKTDDLFEQYFGVRPRSQALFATDAFGNAELFGNNNVAVFPVEPFEIIYSPYASDLYSWYTNPINNIKRYPQLGIDKDPYVEHLSNTDGADQDQVLEDIYFELLEYMLSSGAFYKTSSIADIPNSNGIIDHVMELMIVCNKYYVVKDGLAQDVFAQLQEMVEV